MNLWENKKIIVIAALLLAGVAGNFYGAGEQDREPLEFHREGAEEAPLQKPALVTVYISGAVTSPGIYQVPAGIRVQQALKKAGGFTTNAAVHRVNLAKKCKDGLHINVPWKREKKVKESPATKKAKTVEQQEYLWEESAGKEYYPPGDNPKSTPGKSSEVPPPRKPALRTKKKGGQKVNLNRATKSQLETLPGIGPATAEAIIRHRRWHRFYFKWEIKNVPGISKAKYRAIEHLLEV